MYVLQMYILCFLCSTYMYIVIYIHLDEIFKDNSFE